MTAKTYYPGLSAACRRAVEKLLPELIITAREFGYCLALHGSVARDIDLLAAPWVERPFAPDDLAEGIRRRCAELCPYAEFNPRGATGTSKPHGRLAWSIVIPGAAFIDLSVMPPIGKTKRCAWEALDEDD